MTAAARVPEKAVGGGKPRFAFAEGSPSAARVGDAIDGPGGCRAGEGAGAEIFGTWLLTIEEIEIREGRAGELPLIRQSAIGILWRQLRHGHGALGQVLQRGG